MNPELHLNKLVSEYPRRLVLLFIGIKHHQYINEKKNTKNSKYGFIHAYLSKMEHNISK